jgi:hypothetical protein
MKTMNPWKWTPAEAHQAYEDYRQIQASIARDSGDEADEPLSFSIWIFAVIDGVVW